MGDSVRRALSGRDKKIKATSTSVRGLISSPLAEEADSLAFDDGEPPFTDYDQRPSQNRFSLEALEPRILLSADPISGEFARVLGQDAADEDVYDAALTQQLAQSEVSA